MSNKRYPEQFKIETVKQTTDGRHSIADFANRLGKITHSLDVWVKKYGHEKQYQERLGSV